jgi:hypothetical protein
MIYEPMNHLHELEVEAKTGKPAAIYLYGMALWYIAGHYSDEVHEWFLKAETEGDPESLYQSGIESRDEWDYGDELGEERQMLLSAAVRGHAKSCMALCELEFTCENADWGFNWYRRGRDLGHPHDVEAIGIDYPPLSDGPYASVGADEFQLFLRQRAEAVGRYPEDHISAYAWVSVENYSLLLVPRLSAVFKQSELDEAEILVGEYKEFLKSRPKRSEDFFKGI